MMSKNETALLAALTEAAAVLWQMGATRSAYRAELAIADAITFKPELHENETSELEQEDRQARAEFAEEGSEP